MRAKPVYDSIICFGDSLTQQASGPGGFVAGLQDAYQRRLEVVSRGFSGYTSRQGLALCPKLFEQPHGNDCPATSAKLATVWLGSNDSITPGNAQHVPLDEFRSNMTAILRDHFAATPVLLITPTTVVSGRFGGHEDDRLHQQYGKALVQVVEHVNALRQQAGQADRVVLIDMRALFLQAAQTQPGGLEALFQDDGLHIAGPGYKVVFDALMAAIETYFPHLSPDRLPFVIPDWKTIQLDADAAKQSEQLEPKRF